MTAGRIVGAVLGLLLIAMVGLVAAGWWLLTTEGGRDFVLDRVEEVLPADSSLGAAEGVLAGPLVLRDLHLRDGEQVLRIDRLELDWSQRPLLAGRIHVDRLAADGVRVQLPPSDPRTEPAPRAAVELPDALRLPFPVELAELELTNVSVVRDGDSLGPFALALRARHDGQRIRVERVVAHTPWGEATGNLEVGASGRYPLRGDLDWQADPGEPIPAMRGELRLGGTLTDVDLELDVAAPERVSLRGRIEPLGEVPRWDLVLRFAELHPSTWHADGPDWPLSGNVHMRGEPSRSRLSGDLQAGETPVGGVDTDFALDLRTDGLDLDELAVRLEEPAATLTAGGTLDWDDGHPEIDMEIAWRDLQWPAADADVASPEGHLRIRGDADAYHVTGEILGGPTQYPGGRWDVDLRGHQQGLDDWRVRGDWLAAEWEAGGDLDWRGEPGGRFRLNVDGLDPGRFDLPVPGSIRAATRGDWQITAEGVDADIELTALGGHLADEELAGQGAITIRGERVRLNEIALRAGGGELELDGPITPSPDVRFRLAVDDLGSFMVDADGSVRARGRIEGELASPGLELDLAGDGLAWAGTLLERVRINANLPIDLQAEASLDGELQGLRHDEFELESARFGLDGTLAEHGLDLRLDHQGHGLRTRLTGGVDADNQWSGEVRALDLLPAGHEPWFLASPAPLRAGAEGVELAALCLVPQDAASGEACVDAGWQPDAGWHADVRASALTIAPWIALLAPDLEASGSLALEVSARGRPGTEPEVDARLELGRGQIAIVEPDEEGGRLELVSWQAANVRLQLADRAVEADLDMPLDPEGRITADLRTRLGDGPQPLTGHLAIDSERLPLLARLVPEIGRIEGRVDADFDLAGTTEQPVVDGSVVLADGLVTLPQIGLLLTDVSADFTGEPEGVRVRVGATSDPGELVVEALARRQEGGWRVDGTIEGEQFRAINTPEARVNISPRIEWSVLGREVRVDGHLDVPWARLNPRDLGGAVRPTRDLEIVGPEPQEPATEEERWRVLADVQVELGDDVRFHGFGLRGNIAGGLRLREEPGELTTAIGEVEVVHGTYTAYRQELSIERGRLIYDGGVVTDPGLDIRAVRRPRNVLVGVRVRGTLQEPEVNLFSEPAMQQSQILSYLVLGMPIGEAGDEDRSTLNAAIAGAGGWVAGRVEGGFGIDDITIEEGATQDETELVLGTYLHPRLYVSYGVGLFESFSRIRMRYALGERWAIEGESGPTSSGDLLYSIER